MAGDLLDDLLSEAEAEEEAARLGFEEEDKILAPILEEIDQIDDQPLRSFARAVLLQAPHFFDSPSITRVTEDDGVARLQPPDELGPGGTVLHTKRVVRAAALLCESQGRTRADMDLILTAAVIHDATRMMGLGDEVVYDPYHSVTIDRLIEYTREQDELSMDNTQCSSTLFVSDEIVDQITRLVHCHMGPWSPIREVIPLSSMEWILHYADNFASKIHFVLDGPDLKPGRWDC